MTIMGDDMNENIELSDFVESEEEEQDNPYKRKYLTLKKHIEDICRDNKRLVNRIHHIKRLKHRAKKLRKYLIRTLREHDVDIESIPLPSGLEMSLSTIPIPPISSSQDALSTANFHAKSKTTITAGISPVRQARNGKQNKSKAFLNFSAKKRPQILAQVNQLMRNKSEKEKEDAVEEHLASLYKALTPQERRRFQNSKKAS
ncbi:DgyrCDS2225 [Dimorphilus gyrociliatus]|uniref:DgyrCDS2225 n=1 Tax=Dimorphilus gyrociliatus TaxID=2664684 RepID=A0A7I8VBL0_9ANNE|nr:DgyrCDS2225 [Dimorphilus gyrociliatus]